MAEKMKFIRKNGRIIPIGTKKNKEPTKRTSFNKETGLSKNAKLKSVSGRNTEIKKQSKRMHNADTRLKKSQNKSLKLGLIGAGLGAIAGSKVKGLGAVAGGMLGLLTGGIASGQHKKQKRLREISDNSFENRRALKNLNYGSSI